MLAEGANNNPEGDMLTSCSDEELVSRYNSGDHQAGCFSELVCRYFPFIKGRASVFCTSLSNNEDFVQEGLLGFMKAVRSFDGCKGDNFSAYAHSCVINRMKTAAVRFNRQTRDENGDESIAEDNTTPESIIIGREFMGSLEQMLSGREYEIFMLYVSGLSCGEIAGRLGISQKSADNAVQRARRKLRAEFYSG